MARRLTRSAATEAWLKQNPLRLWRKKHPGRAKFKMLMERSGVKSRQAVHAWISGIALPRIERMIALESLTGITPGAWLQWWNQRPTEGSEPQTEAKPPSRTGEEAAPPLPETNGVRDVQEFSSADSPSALSPPPSPGCETGDDSESPLANSAQVAEDNPLEEQTRTRSSDRHYQLPRNALILFATWLICCGFIASGIVFLWTLGKAGPSAATAALGFAFVGGILGVVVGAQAGSRWTALFSAMIFAIAGGMAGLLLGGSIGMLIHPVTQALGGR